jgi:hypothetical protein
VWTELSRERIGFAPDPTDEINSHTPLAELLLIASTAYVTDDPTSDILLTLAAELELLALCFASGVSETQTQRPEVDAFRSLARRARVAAALHVRVGEALGAEIDDLRARATSRG